jgi:hypothetical protein
MEMCECGHLRGEHMGSYTTVDDGPCNSRGAIYAGKKRKLDQVRGATNNGPLDICKCIGFRPVVKQIITYPNTGRTRAGLGA